MTEQVRVISGKAGVARIVLCNPPLNAITGAMRAGIMQALNMVLSNPSTQAVLLLAEGRTFPSGAEMSDADASPTLGEVCDALEAAPVPVIAVVHGTALGAGCALTLGAHYRICGAQAAFGFPEVTLGRVPDAGTTQRLPRLVGAQAALELMLAGRPVAAPEAARLGLVDQVIDGDPRGAAQDYAEALIAQGQGPRPIAPRIDHLTDGRSFQSAVSAARLRLRGAAVPAMGRIVDCIEGAQLLPFETGVEYERAAAAECAASPAAAGLFHMYQCERRLTRLPEIAGDDPGRIERVELRGRGAIAAGWAVITADSGTPVLVPNPEDRADILGGMRAIYDDAIGRGRLAEAQRDARLALVRDDEAGARDLVIDFTGKAPAQAAAGLADGALLALHAQGDLVAELDPDTPDMVALAGSGQPHLSRLTEMLEPAGLEPGARLRLLRFFKRVGRITVPGPVDGGGLGGALWGACIWAANEMALRGADPARIDEALRAYGLNRSPFQGRQAPVAQSDADAMLRPEEIALRCEAAIANTGALLIEAGMARVPGQIDLVMVHGYGFPRWRGGPMLAADQRGLLAMRKRLRALAESGDADFWAPSALFDTLIKNGLRFDDLNAGDVRA